MTPVIRILQKNEPNVQCYYSGELADINGLNVFSGIVPLPNS